MRRITKEDVIELHNEISKNSKVLSGVRDGHLIDSAIGSAYQSFDGIDVYSDNISKISRLGLGLAKNHAFVDGNKRTALAVICTYFEYLGYSLTKNDIDIVAIKLLESVSSSAKWSEILEEFNISMKRLLNYNESLVEKKKRKKNYQANPCAGNVEKNVDFFNLVMNGDTSNDSSLFASDGSFVGGESLTTEDYIKQANDLYEQELKLKETSYNRVLNHINSGEFVIISPYREEYSEKENKLRMRELQSIVRKNLKLGYIWLKSTWNSFNEKGEPNTVEEESLLVPNMTLKQGIELGVKYEQFSIIVKDEDGLKEICTTPYGSNFKVGDVVQSFNYSDRDSLGLDEVRNILQHKKEGSISTSKKGKVSFSLKKLEKLNRPAFSSFDDRILTTELYSSDEQELEEANKTSKALFGDYSNKIKTFGIVSAENPNSKELPSNENARRTNQLKQRLRTMVLQFKKLYGIYKENKERSFIIFNCSLNEMKELAKDFEQESFFFGVTKEIDTNSKERKTASSISYYQRVDENSPYELIETSDNIVTDIDFNDFYSKHKGLNFKIDMDFFKEELESLKAPYDKELLEKMINDDNYVGYTPQKRWRDRITVYRSKLKESNKMNKALFGDYYNKIRTFTILTAENPLVDTLNIGSNKERTELLKKYLKDGHFESIEVDGNEVSEITTDNNEPSEHTQYKKIKGSYGEIEHSFMIFNISLESSKAIAKRFGQESFFYGRVSKITNDMKGSKDISRNTTATIEYYKATRIVKTKDLKDTISDYKLIEVSNKIDNMSDALDFYSKHKGTKFSIKMKEFENLHEIMNEDALALELNDKIKGSSKFYNRQQIYRRK